MTEEELKNLKLGDYVYSFSYYLDLSSADDSYIVYCIDKYIVEDFLFTNGAISCSVDDTEIVKFRFPGGTLTGVLLKNYFTQKKVVASSFDMIERHSVELGSISKALAHLLKTLPIISKGNDVKE